MTSKKKLVILSQDELKKILERKRLKKMNLALNSKKAPQSQPISSESIDIKVVGIEKTTQSYSMVVGVLRK